MNNAIEEKSFRFAVRIVRLCKYLQAQSRADFVSKLNIALKEAVETNYWLRLLRATDYLTDSEFSSAITDCKELERLLTAIIKTTRNSPIKTS